MPRRHTVCTVAVCSALLGIATATPPPVQELVGKSMTATPDPRHGRVLYLKRCSACHGRDGWGDGIRQVPGIAGQREAYLIIQLSQFALLERNGSSMHRATGPTDVVHPQAIRDLSAYLSGAPPNPKPDYGDGDAVLAGEKLFQGQCAQCHGQAAQGRSQEPIPALAGQHYQYTLLQLKNFAAGHRGQVEPPVIDFTAGLSMEDQSAIADYLSRLKPRSP